MLTSSPCILLNDGFSTVKTVAGIEAVVKDNDLIASVVLCEFPSFKIIEKQTYLLSNPLPYKPGYLAYREMPAMIEAYNQLEEEADLIIVKGPGVNHPRKFGLAAHLGLALGKSTIGVSEKLTFGKIEKGNIILNNEIVGFEVKTREHANPVYVSPGHLITLGSSLDLISKMIIHPHKMPEPLHIAHKVAKKVVK